MDIEQYSDKRREEILSLIRSFHQETFIRHGQQLELEAIYRSIDQLRHHSFLLIIDGICVGVFAGIDLVMPINNKKAFQQIIWYVDKDYRRKSIFFLRKVMKLLKDEGYELLIATLLHNDGLKKKIAFFKKIGFNPLETHLLKTL